MQLNWNAAQLALRDKYADFGRTVVAPGAGDRDRAGEFHHAGWKDLADAGFWRTQVDQEAGGERRTLWEFLASLEGLALGAEDSGFVLSAVAHAGLIHVLAEHGTDDQRRRILPSLLNGALGATAATEPQGGSHVAAVATTARRSGEGWLLSGEKSHITNAPAADFLLVVGRMPELGKRDITLFVVERGRTGLETGEHEDLLGQRTSPTGPIHLRDVPVTSDDIVGAPGEGLATLYSFLAFDRLMYGIVVASQIESALPPVVDHITNRRAFGVTLSEHEMVQEKIVMARTTVESSRHLAYAAAAALMRGDEQFSALASCAKLAASEGGVQAAVELMQVYGHAGYEKSANHERHLRDSLAIRIAGGTSEMQKKNIFKDTVGRYAVTDRRVEGRSS